MSKPGRLKLVFYLNLLLVGVIVAYKIYLNFFEQDFGAVHAAQVERIQARLQGRESLRFAVVGNIQNSVGIFERRLIPMLNQSGVDFVVSAGNAVTGGGEDKYRALYRSLGRLEAPYLLTFGENEGDNFGGYRFYRHFGPYYFAFTAGGCRFVFLDSTGKTAYAWQLRWLEEELAGSRDKPTFIFIGRPLRPVDQNMLLRSGERALPSAAFRDGLESLIRRYRVDAVFSGNLPLYAQRRVEGTDYIVTGGGGGSLMLDADTSFYHYVTVRVTDGEVQIAPQRLDTAPYPFLQTVESLWFLIHSLFYIDYLNFLLVVGLLLLVASRLYLLVFVDRDYYPSFDVDPAPFMDQPLRVAMFTNTFLPFVGGVPISIERLRRGLVALGHRVLVLAPRYRQHREPDPDTLRLATPLAFGKRKEFHIANLLQPRAWRRVLAFRPQVIHVHHPFWLGSLGLFLARRLRVPAVYSYHTRLEHYGHFVRLPSPLFRNLLSHYLIKRFANKCDGVIVPTHSAEEYLRLLGVHTDIFVQPTGIEYDRLRRTDSAAVEDLRRRFGIRGERVLVSASRLSKEKNIDFMFDAVGELAHHSRVPFKLVVIGSGDERARLQARIEAQGLGDTMVLAGEVPPERMPAYYQLGDVFLFASKSETQGLVILEAMAAGLPVVAVRSSGIDDVVHNGINGYKTAENPGRWRDKVALLLNDDELRRRLGDNAQRFAKDFDIAQFAREVAAVYAHVLAARAQAAANKSADRDGDAAGR